VVDDNRDAADSLAALLEVDGHSVRTAYDGEEGLAAFIEFEPAVAVLDIGMPKLSGHELARRIRQLPSGADATLIAATGWGQAADRRESALAGFDHHLTKPVDMEHLTHILSTKVRSVSKPA
jgi:CheY-like chemotaxis protein